MTEDEIQAMENLEDKDKPYNFIPKKHDCLRHVAGYENFVKERFERCLDLYLCPRKLKKRLNIDPETLLPRLPKPRELKPFPNSLCIQFLGHKKAVTSISISPDGQYLASGSSDGSIRLWELDTALCVRNWKFGKPVTTVVFNPNPSHCLLAAAVDTDVVFISTGLGDQDSTELTDSLLEAAETSARGNEAAWKLFPDASQPPTTRFGSTIGPRVVLTNKDAVTGVTWHSKGDYIAVLCPQSGARAVSIHQLSKAKSQFPFSKTAGKIQAVNFHPSRPFLFVATQQSVKLYNLIEQKLVKKLLSGCKWLSSMSIHHSGDHLILGRVN